MSWRTIGGAVATAVILGGIILIVNDHGDRQVQPGETPSVTPKTVPTPSVLTEGGPSTNPLALTTFAEQEFNGRELTVGRVLSTTDAYTRHYITYKSGDLTISGIMNKPSGAGPFPVLILNHGFIDPAIYANGRGLKREQDYLARQGYVVVHSDYRNHAESSKDAHAEHNLRQGYVEDVINVIYAIQAANLPYIDEDKIGMLGHSMGGGVAFAVAVTQPDLVDAIVLFAPVSADMRDNFERWLSRRPEVAERIAQTYGLPADNPTFWDEVSPRTYFSRIRVPLMIHHGTADESVPLAWSERATEDLKHAHKDVTLHVYPNEPHEFATAWPTVMARTTSFFDQALKR